MYFKNITLLLIISFLTSFHAYADKHRGESLYLENCSICHGIDGQGGMGVPLSLDTFLQSASDDYLKHSIRLGRPNRIMPSYYWMPEADIEQIIQYISSWRKSPAPTWDNTRIKGNVNKGKILFSKNCTSCHGDNGQGGKGSGLHFSRTTGTPITAPALNNQGLLNSAPDKMLHYIITHGREGTPMPSARSLGLNKENINDLVSYIRSYQIKNLQKTSLYEEEPATLIVESPYSFDETIENVKRAITGSNFIHIRDQELTDGFETQSTQNPKQTIIYFCSFSFLYEALKIDPRVGMFLPCRVTVIEHDNKVLMLTINPKHLSQLFNNNELDTSCDQMHEVYTSILEDASL